MSILNTLTIEQLKQAISIKEQIVGLENELAALSGSAPATAVVAKPVPAAKVAPAAKPAKQGLSAEGRAKLAAAAKARWALIKAAKAKLVTAPKAAVKPAPAKATSVSNPAKKWKISEEGMAKIKAAAKAYWAKKKAEKK